MYKRQKYNFFICAIVIGSVKISVDLARNNSITTLDIFVYMIHGCAGIIPGRLCDIFTADMPHVMTDK